MISKENKMIDNVPLNQNFTSYDTTSVAYFIDYAAMPSVLILTPSAFFRMYKYSHVAESSFNLKYNVEDQQSIIKFISANRFLTMCSQTLY